MEIEDSKRKFFSKVKVVESLCWEWQGTRSLQNYGRFTYRNSRLAHRFSYFIHKGEIPDGQCVLHKCDNPPCVNPDHLFLGDRGVNNKDRNEKGRTVIFNSLKTHCKFGHEFSEENTRWRPNGSRLCRACARRRKKTYRKKNNGR